MRAALQLGFGKEDVIQTYQCARVLPDGHLCNKLVEVRLGDWVPWDMG